MTQAELTRRAEEQAERVEAELEALVAVSSPSGDHEGAETAVALCADFLPEGMSVERLPCSTEGFPDDMAAVMPGSGRGRILLLGHLDTVIGHQDHVPMRRQEGRLYGPGTADMKGGVAVSLAIARELASMPSRFEELAVLLVCDEEWRKRALAHVERFAGYDACLCFEAGERTASGEEGVIVRRKGAASIRVEALGRAAHSGSAPQDGRNALLALSRTAIELAGHADPDGPSRLTVVPTKIRAGVAVNVVPPEGELLVDLRSRETDAFRRVLESVPGEVDGVSLSAELERVWPAMDSLEATRDLLARASGSLGRPIIGGSRGGASDASHFAPEVPLTVDGLGPRGGGAHTPWEFVQEESLGQRVEVALAVALAALESE